LNYLKWFAYFVSEAFQNIRSNLATSIVTTFTIAISLSVCGLFLVFFINVNNMLSGVGGQIQITAYIRGNLQDDAVLHIKDEISAMHEVESVEYISKEMALNIFKTELKGQKGILDGLAANPLPASFEIKVKELFRTQDGIKGLISKLRLIGGIEDVQYGKEWVDRFFAFIRLVEVFIFILGGFILSAAAFIASNTIRLALYTRKDEIEIMGLLGATNIFIKTPYFIEGILEGFSGAVLAVSMLYLGRYMILMEIPPIFSPLVAVPFSPFYFSLGVVAGGIILGIAGSGIALRRFLKS